MTLHSRRHILAAGTAAAFSLLAPGIGAAQQARRSRVVLLGTQGGPNVRLARGETASAVVVDDVPYLVDCGYGALRALVAAGMQYRDVPRVFLTHLHDDHVADIPALLSHQWTAGRVEPTDIHGPVGTADLVRAAIEFQKANTEIRIVDEGRTVRPEMLFHGHDLQASATPRAVLDDGRVRVNCVENSHFPAESREKMPYRSLAFRFDCPDRSVVFSGDTAYSQDLVKLAKGADLLVCEAMELATTRSNFERRVAGGEYRDNPEGVWNHIQGTHSPLDAVGRMATEAGVKAVVLNHLVPGALLEIPDTDYIEGVRKTFNGTVILGRDLMIL